MRFTWFVLLLAGLTTGEGLAQCPDCDGDGFVPPADCDDGSAAIHPGAAEVCDGLDNDCDGYVDGAVGCDGNCALSDKLGMDHRVSNPLGDANEPAIVWTGDAYGIAWHESIGAEADIFFNRLDAQGNPAGAPVRITSGGSSFRPRIAWNGSGYALTWISNGQIVFARLDGAGQRLGSDVVVGGGSNPNGQALVWTGSGYGVAWDANVEGSNSEIFFARLDHLGTVLGSALRVTNAPTTSLLPDVAWAGNGFGLTWYDLRDGNLEIYFARLAADGAKIGGDVRVTITPTHSSSPEIEWSGSEFGLVWQDQPEPGNVEIYFGRLDPSGNPIGAHLRVTNQPALSSHAALARTGGGYGIAWYDLRDGNAEIYFQHVLATGALGGLPVRLTADPGFVDNPVLAWTGENYGVAWHDQRLGLRGVYFTRVGCLCLEGDGDGFSSCRDCDNTRPDIHPGALDLCDTVDQNCDGVDGTDQDLDGASTCTGDCNDALPHVYPGAPEICDGRDNDCNGPIDDADADADGFAICQDCDDGDPAVNPDTPEVCDGADNNCNDLVDDDLSGQDADDDTVAGACDNCPVNANTDQTDRDADGVGDACDLNDGVIWVTLPNKTQVTWQPELGFDAYNEYRGDLEVLRATGVYTQDPAIIPLAARNCGLGTTSVLDGPNPPPGRALFYLVTGTRAGVEGSLGTNSAGLERPNDYPCP